jgi:hypothetical protein
VILVFFQLFSLREKRYVVGAWGSEDNDRDEDPCQRVDLKERFLELDHPAEKGELKTIPLNVTF